MEESVVQNVHAHEPSEDTVNADALKVESNVGHDTTALAGAAVVTVVEFNTAPTALEAIASIDEFIKTTGVDADAEENSAARPLPQIRTANKAPPSELAPLPSGTSSVGRLNNSHAELSSMASRMVTGAMSLEVVESMAADEGAGNAGALVALEQHNKHDGDTADEALDDAMAAAMLPPAAEYEAVGRVINTTLENGLEPPEVDARTRTA
jgi:hypothetical protein